MNKVKDTAMALLAKRSVICMPYPMRNEPSTPSTPSTPMQVQCSVPKASSTDFSEDYLSGHRHRYKTGKIRFILTGKKLEHHIDVMCSNNRWRVSRYKVEAKFENVLEIEYYSCPNRCECIKELKHINHHTLESIEYDNNEGNIHSNRELEKIMPTVHRHVYKYKTGRQQILFGSRLTGLINEIMILEDHPYAKPNVQASVSSHHTFIMSPMEAGGVYENEDTKVTEIEYHCCRNAFKCAQELDYCVYSCLKLVKSDQEMLDILESLLPEAQRAKIKLMPHTGPHATLDASISADRAGNHIHIYQDCERRYIIGGYHLKEHMSIMQSKNNQLIKQYITNKQLDDVSKIEYLSCPVECIWEEELEYFLMLDSIKCDRDIRFINQSFLLHGIVLNMPKHHMHVYRKTDGNKLVLTGDLLQKHIIGMSSTDKNTVKMFIQEGNLKKVASVEYYACPHDSSCVGELKYLLNFQLKSVKSDGEISHFIRVMMSYGKQSNIQLSMPEVHSHVYSICKDGQEIILTQNVVTKGTFQDVTKIDWSNCNSNCNNGLTRILQKYKGETMNQLKTLNLENMSLGTLPDSIGILKHLEHLTATHCHLSEIPDAIGNLTSLKYLVLFGNPGLTELSSSLGNCTQLEFIDLRKCGLKVFPGTVLKLCEKTVIRMTDNPIQVISKEDIKKMVQLKKKIRQPSVEPGTKGTTKVIGKLTVTFQSPSIPPQPVLNSQNPTDWLSYFDECKVSATTKQCTLMNVVVLGQTEAGKSSLMRSLAHGIAQMAPKDDRTVILDELV